MIFFLFSPSRRAPSTAFAVFFVVGLLLSTAVVAAPGAPGSSSPWPLIDVPAGAPIAPMPEHLRVRKARPVLHERLSPRLEHLLARLYEAKDPGQIAAAAGAHMARLNGDELQVRIHLRALGDGSGVLDLEPEETIHEWRGVSFVVERQRDIRVQARVAWQEVLTLADDPRVDHIALPVRPRLFEVTSKGVKNMEADTLHDIGVKGKGIIVALVDGGFSGYEKLLGTELPEEVIARGFGIGIEGGGEVHGTAVAELVHDVAPEATLVFVSYGTVLDFEDALDWLVSNAVDIISTSTGSAMTGPCDGRDTMAVAANAAVDAGVTFFASAGNYGDGHYVGVFNPGSPPVVPSASESQGPVGVESPPEPFFHRYTPTRKVAYFGMGNQCFGLPKGMPLSVVLTWNDWGLSPHTMEARADYDLYLLRYDGERWQYTDVVADYKQLMGGYPWEAIQATVPEDGCYGLAVSQANAMENHRLHVYVYNMNLALHFVVPQYSVIAPCVGEKVQCIGATSTYDSLTSYSSQGPANLNEATGEQLTKPDFTGPAGTKTATYGSFSGTSAAAPHVAGAFTLMLEVAGRDHEAAMAMMRELALDLGETGVDNAYGWGRTEVAACTNTFCEDHLPCTETSCDPLVGCATERAGDGCWIDEACYPPGGVNPQNECEHCDIGAPIFWTARTNGLACDDGLACTVGESCQAGTCWGGEAPDCSFMDDLCHVGVCDEVEDHCVARPVEDEAPCLGPHGPCDQRRCEQGVCVAMPKEQAPECSLALCASGDDGLACQLGEGVLPGLCERSICQGAACVLVTLSDGTPCDDGDYCTDGDACEAGTCLAGDPRDCSALEGPCHQASCDSDLASCALSAFPAGTDCGADARCGDGLLWPAEACDGLGACVAPPAQGCAPYAGCFDAGACMASCADEGDCAHTFLCREGLCVANLVPSADAGATQAATVGDTVILDGSASIDSDGQSLSFIWKQLEGAEVTLGEAQTATPSFEVPEAAAGTTLLFRLFVHDGLASSAPSLCKVVVEGLPNLGPIADAGPDVSVEEGEIATLDGSASEDPDAKAEEKIRFVWTQETGPEVELEEPYEAIVSFLAPEVDEDTVVVLRLVVRDALVSSEPVLVEVTILDVPEVTAEEAEGSEDEPEVVDEVQGDATDDSADALSGADAAEAPLVIVKNDVGKGCALGRGVGRSAGAWPSLILFTLLALILAMSSARGRARLVVKDTHETRR